MSGVCHCGWQKPLIALATSDGTDPPAHVFPMMVCPNCAEIHTPSNIPVELAARVVGELVAEIQETLATTIAQRPS